MAAEAAVPAWGAAAVATVGPVTVEVDEALATPDWQLSLDTPAIYLRLRINGPETITRLHEFLTARLSGAAMEFTPGRHRSQNVLILRDDEPQERCFIVIGAADESSVRLTLSVEECQQWGKALEDIRGQLRG